MKNLTGTPQLCAWLIALYAVEVLVPIIDIFGLPLPRHIASMSFSTAFMVAALGMLIPLARLQRVALPGPAGLAVFGMLAFWCGLEAIGTAGRSSIRFNLILEWLPLLLVTIAARLHLKAFNQPQLLVRALVLTATGLVALHTLLLLAVLLDIPLPLVRTGELTGRNAMTLLLPVCLWLLAFFRARVGTHFLADTTCLQCLPQRTLS